MNERADWEDLPDVEPVDDWESLPDVQPAPEKKEATLGDKALAFATGLGRGVTMGFGDELAAGVAAPFRAISEGKGLGDAYRLERDENRAINRQISDLAPKQALVGELVGGVAIPTPFGKAKAATTLGKVGLAGARGVVQGGLYGLGESEAESLPGWLSDAGKGAAVGAAAGSAGQGLASGVGALGSAAKSFARYMAPRAAGALKSSLNKLSPQQIDKAADMLLEGGAMKFGSGAEEISTLAGGLRKKYGGILGSVRKKATDAGAVADVGAVTSALNTEAGKLSRKAFAKGDQAQLLGEAERLAEVYGPRVGAEDMAELATSLQQKTPFGSAASMTKAGNKAKAAVARAARAETDRAVRSGVDAKTFAKYLRAQGKYGTAKTVQGWADDAVKAERGNAPLGLRDLGVGGAFGLSLDGENATTGGMFAAVLSRLVRRRGGSAAAIGLNKLSKLAPPVVEKLNAVAAKSPMAAVQMARELGLFQEE